jgi:hypothetical protein
MTYNEFIDKLEYLGWENTNYDVEVGRHHVWHLVRNPNKHHLILDSDNINIRYVIDDNVHPVSRKIVDEAKSENKLYYVPMDKIDIVGLFTFAKHVKLVNNFEFTYQECIDYIIERSWCDIDKLREIKLMKLGI